MYKVLALSTIRQSDKMLSLSNVRFVAHHMPRQHYDSVIPIRNNPNSIDLTVLSSFGKTSFYTRSSMSISRVRLISYAASTQSIFFFFLLTNGTKSQGFFQLNFIFPYQALALRLTAVPSLPLLY